MSVDVAVATDVQSALERWQGTEGGHPLRAMWGDEFVFGEEAELEVIWGTPERTAWAAGEGLMLFGPQGTGKTTLAHQLLRARLGLATHVLGMPVQPEPRRVLYIAADRPRQAARAVRRLFTPDDLTTLRDKLRVWTGPLPRDVVTDVDILIDLAAANDAGTLFIDSLKDIAARLSEDGTGNAFNTAMQRCVSRGVQVCVLHHPRKLTALAGTGPRGVDDIYGSTFLTAGLGSILSLHGKAGDTVVQLSQLKTINDEVGPFDVVHDHERGISMVQTREDPGAVLAASGLCTVRQFAEVYLGVGDPSRTDLERCRRMLDALVKAGKATVMRGGSGGAGGGVPTTYRAVGDPVADTKE